MRDRRVSGWDQRSQPPGPNFVFPPKGRSSFWSPLLCEAGGAHAKLGKSWEEQKGFVQTSPPAQEHPHNPERRATNAGSGQPADRQAATWTAALLATLGSQSWSFSGGPVVKNALLLRGSIPGLGIRILQAAQSGQKKKKSPCVFWNQARLDQATACFL